MREAKHAAPAAAIAPVCLPRSIAARSAALAAKL
jgi:hypothetical protein